MKALEYLRILRRRWYFVAAAVVVAGVAGFLTAPGASSMNVSYYASNTLVPTDQTFVNLDQARLFVTTGSVPDRAVTILNDGTTREEVVGSTSSSVDTDTNSMVITATSATPEKAVAIAGALTDALLGSYIDDDVADYEANLANANKQIETISDQITVLNASIDPASVNSPEGISLASQLNALQASLADQRNLQQQLLVTGPPQAPLRVIERGNASQIQSAGVSAPNGKPQRAVLLALFGLAAGSAGAIMRDKIDTRIRGKHDAEAAFGVPVIAEIPPIPNHQRHHGELLTVAQPSSPVVESYRALRTVVLYSAAHKATTSTNGSGQVAARKLGAEQHAHHDCQVVLMTSPGASEGKTTTAAHLAALLAEVGKSVLVISADFRKPRIHELFEVPREPGLADVLTGASNLSIADLKTSTNVAGVTLFPSGSPVNNPAPFLRETAELIAAARQLFDYIVVDTAPLLVANDATELAGVADMVVIMTRSEQTTNDSAQRSMEILRRVDAPVLGTVLVASTDTPTAYRYYRYRYFEEDVKAAKKRRPGRKALATTSG